MRKRIGVLVAQVDENMQRRFMTAFLKEAYSHDYDVCVFSMYQKFQETELRNVGDSNIYRLVPLHLFDAVLILLDTILTPGLTDSLQRDIKEQFDGPVLVVDHDSEYFPNIRIDHYTPVFKLVSHLIEVHHKRDIAFLGGKEGHPHSVARFNAYKDAMIAHNLPIDEELIYHGNYWYDSAEYFAEKIMEREKLPEALVCANDIMAVAAATVFTEHGINVPDQIAIVGYDSMEDGRNSPVPVTSAEIPADECGAYSLEWLHAALNGETPPKFKAKAPLFIGGSCGCEYHPEMVPKKLRNSWRTHQSSNSFFSDFNHLLEDLLSQTDYKSFYTKIFEYVYQIKPFHSFYMCLNENFMYPEQNIGVRAIRSGFSTKMHQIIACSGDPDGENTIDFLNYFQTETLLPQLYEERDYPTCFIFTPIYFDDRCFGYAAINYGEEIRVYDETYRVWMRSIMQGMEAFYRQQTLQKMLEQIKSSQVRDELTGLYNYRGFLNLSFYMSLDCQDAGTEICIIALDIKELSTINNALGRSYGNRVIRVMARFLQEILDDEEVCCRMSNDEFLVAIAGASGCRREQVILEKLREKFAEYRLPEANDITVEFHSASLSGSPDDSAALESLINHTVGEKNHSKALSRKKQRSDEELTLLQLKRNQLVEHVLDNNLLDYYFQPIISAVDGSVYAHEALMRCESEESLHPGEILEAAGYLDRLYDIEKATITNVLLYIENNGQFFENAKVFVNSLPGYQLKGDDAVWVNKKLREQWGKIVIEFTEESEISDDRLKEFRDHMMESGTEIALDDYGAGYSNVNNLLRYMPRYVKIDRMLITDIQNSPQKQHFVRSIVDFSHANNIMALAEGVESSEELREVIKLNVDLIQGYYVSKPCKEPMLTVPESICEEIIRCRASQSEYESIY